MEHKIDMLVVITGTGPNRLTKKLAEFYYRDLLALHPEAELFTLPYAGFAHPWLRHQVMHQILEHKVKGRILRVGIIVHSQASNEGIELIFSPRLPADVHVVFMVCLSGAHAGSTLAKFGMGLRFVPRPIRVFADGILEMIPGSESERHLEQKIELSNVIPHRRRPHIYLVGAQNDLFIRPEDAWHWDEHIGHKYPKSKLHRLYLAGKPEEIPRGIKTIKTTPEAATHIGMVSCREMIEYLALRIGVAEPQLSTTFAA